MLKKLIIDLTPINLIILNNPHEKTILPLILSIISLNDGGQNHHKIIITYIVTIHK